MRRFITVLPSVEPLVLADVKRWLRVDHTQDEDLIIGLIKAARERIEARTGRSLLAQSWRIVLDQWPADGRVILPVMPVLSVTSVRVVDINGAFIALATEQFALDQSDDPPVLAIANPIPVQRPRNGIEIDVVAGYGTTPEQCPQSLQQAMILLVMEMHARRGPDPAVATPDNFSASFERLIAPYRSIRLGTAALRNVQ
jgi:uncharacterized phiE125 gp8 family phage protein